MFYRGKTQVAQLTPIQALGERWLRTPKRHRWPIPPGTNVRRFNEILDRNVQKLQAGGHELAFVLPDFGLTAPFDGGNEFLEQADRALPYWTVRLGELLTFKPNKEIMRSREFTGEDTRFIYGVYLLCGHPVSYRELCRAIPTEELNPTA
jgi:hypothetical protein